MKRITPAIFFILILYCFVLTSCKKQNLISKISVITPEPNSAQLLIAQATAKCDSLSNALSSSNNMVLTLNADIGPLTSSQSTAALNVDSAKAQGKLFLTQIATFNTQLTTILSEIGNSKALLETSDTNSVAVTEQVNADLSRFFILKQQYTALSVRINQMSSSVEPLISSKSYITVATAQNERNDEGDVIVCPGYYLSVYTRFNANISDIGYTTLVGKMSTDTTGKTWGNEFIVCANIGSLNVMSPSLYRINATTIACYFMVKNSTRDIRIFETISPDNGFTWPAATQVIYGRAYDIVNNGAVRVVNRNRIMAAACSVPEFTAGCVFSDFDYYSDDDGVTWQKSSSITAQVTEGGVEPTIVQLSGDTCLMSMRTQTGYQYFSLSTDNGATWGAPYKSNLVSSFSPAKIVNVSGKLIAVHNYSATMRNPFSISVSTDRGATWAHVKDIEAGNPNIYGWSYPSVTISNGYLLISYYETVVEPAPISQQWYNQKFTKIAVSSL